MLQFIVHYFLHLVFPLALAWLFFRKDWKKAYLLMLITMLVDLDHLVADPIYDPNRCSIGFHPLHSYFAMPFYVGMLFINRFFKAIGIGLIFHMTTDWIDCVWMQCAR